MRKTRNLKLNLLALENRLAPAVTASLASGSLSVSGDTAAHTILVSGSTGSVNVYAIAGDQYAAYQTNPAAFLAANEIPANQIGGTFNVTGFVAVTAKSSALSQFVLVTVDSAGLPGDCSITTGAANDELIIQARNNDRPNVGRVNMSAGAGADNMFIFDMNVTNAMTVDGGTSGFRPGVNSATAPGDVFEVFDCATKGVNVTSAIVGIDDQYGGSTINGNLTVNDPIVFAQGGFFVNNVPYPAGYNMFGDPGYNGLLVINSNSVVNGNVTYAGSGDSDGTYIQGTVNGNVSVNGGTTTSTGFNDFVLSGKVTGFYTAAGADGVDHAGILTGAYVGGPAQFNFRDGNNTYDLDHTFKIAATATVTTVGMTITAGTGDDVVGRISGTIGSNSGVAVNQVYNLGAGNNSLIWNGTFVGSTSSRLDFTTLGGTDDLDVYNNNAFRLFASMGDGDDTINVFPNTKVSFSQLDFGLGNDTFNRNGNPIPLSFWGSNAETNNP
jgi:hypothetical protein